MPTYPVDSKEKKITSKYGPRDGRNHYGVDFRTEGRAGVPILSIVAGEVIYSGTENGYGNVVVIQNTDGTAWLYAHLSQSDVIKNTKVTEGMQIGASGNTGIGSGPHLHVELIDVEGVKKIISAPQAQNTLNLKKGEHRLDCNSFVEQLAGNTDTVSTDDAVKVQLKNQLTAVENEIAQKTQANANFRTLFDSEFKKINDEFNGIIKDKEQLYRDADTNLQNNNVIKIESRRVLAEKQKTFNNNNANYSLRVEQTNQLIQQYHAYQSAGASSSSLKELYDTIQSLSLDVNQQGDIVVVQLEQVEQAKRDVEKKEVLFSVEEAEVGAMKTELDQYKVTAKNQLEGLRANRNAAITIEQNELQKSIAVKNDILIKLQKLDTPRYAHDRRELSVEDDDQVTTLQTSSALPTASPWLNYPIHFINNWIDNLLTMTKQYAGDVVTACPNYFPKSSPSYWKNNGSHTPFWSQIKADISTNSHASNVVSYGATPQMLNK